MSLVRCSVRYTSSISAMAQNLCGNSYLAASSCIAWKIRARRSSATLRSCVTNIRIMRPGLFSSRPMTLTPNRQIGCLRQNFSEDVEKQGYASLGGTYVSKRPADVTANAKTFEEVSKIWQRSVPVAASAVSQLQNGRSTASFYANADFMVHKRLLFKVEPEVWKDFQDLQRIKTAQIGFRIGFAFEATWHIIWEAIARGGVRTPSLHQASYPLDFSCGIYDCERTPKCKNLADKLVPKKKARR
ncbi:unnamed protein product [Polarella glacialis]|uniref:Uncharacterized protein n=1 Tax=Polarella glacialis TaxID=89957 RepID=A0A813KTP5_POLGL|nr:unnamed protein product [Polarella glacialis]